MAGLQDRTYHRDANLRVADGAAAIAASGYAQNGGANGIVDLGGNQGTTPKQQDRFDGVMVVDVSAINTGAGFSYGLAVVGSNDPALASGNVVLSRADLGAGASLAIPNGGTTPAAPGTAEIFFTNQQFGLIYEFIALYVVVGGAGSITLQAYVCTLPRP
jgi:hypothetical protein